MSAPTFKYGRWGECTSLGLRFRMIKIHTRKSCQNAHILILILNPLGEFGTPIFYFDHFKSLVSDLSRTSLTRSAWSTDKPKVYAGCDLGKFPFEMGFAKKCCGKKLTSSLRPKANAWNAEMFLISADLLILHLVGINLGHLSKHRSKSKNDLRKFQDLAQQWDTSGQNPGDTTSVKGISYLSPIAIIRFSITQQ